MLRVGAVVVLAAALTAPAAARPRRIACIGDSITYDVTQPSGAGPGGAPDRGGGYPGRLQRRLADVRVLNRGLGGTTTSVWLDAPAGAALWPAVAGPWCLPSTRREGPLVERVLRADRARLAIVLLGVNDLHAAGTDPVAVADRLDLLLARAAAVAGRALVGTVVPNPREPDALVALLNAEIRARHPDFLPLGERFAAAGGTALFADDVHPSPEGYETLAAIVAEELVARGLARAAERPNPARACGASPVDRRCARCGIVREERG